MVPGSKAGFPPVWQVAPIAGARGQVRLPGSKSISNRALLLAALARGQTRLTGLLDADDTRVMVQALRTLGVAVEREGDSARITGCGGNFAVREASFDLGNAGTAMRPLAAALAFAGGHYRLDGVARMRERPIGDLVDALREAGARVDYLGQPGFPPLQILPAQEAPDGRASLRVRGAVSSQFLTGLLIAAPGIAGAQGLRIEVQGELISRPYVELTLGMMRQFGARVSAQGNAFEVAPGAYAAPGEYPVEGDASGASYFLALGALAGGPVRVQGVGANSLQGDVAFARVLARMGARVQTGPDWIEAAAPADARLQGIEFDATEIPDAAMTLAVLAAFAQGPTRLTGIGSWRVKETDRIAAMATELAKLGAQVQSGPDWLAVTPPARLQAAQIATYDDHRMAMCFALAACGGAPIDILEPACVSKTYPDFFVELERLRQPA